MGDAVISESFLIRGVTFDVDPNAKPVDFDKNVSHVAPSLGNLDRDKNGIRYYLANDEAEHSRLNLQHEMLSLIIQSLYRAPIKSPKTVIDIATGTGIWATEFAKLHPDSTVIGTDINPVTNPPSVANLSYRLHDAEKDSWETLAPVDYIHARFVVTCFDDAPKVVSSMFNSLSSGGWLEFQDICFEVHDPDGSVKGTLIDKYLDMLNEAGEAVSRDIHKPKRYAEWMRQAGFVDVQEVIIPFPGNTWVKDERQKKIGEIMIRNMIMGQRSLSGMLTQKWSEEELKDVKDNVVEASANPQVHSYWELYVVYGRKP